MKTILATLLTLASDGPEIPLCAPHGELVATIGKLYGEKLAGFGRDSDGNMVEVYVGENTWSALVVNGDQACFASVGFDWQVIPLPPNL